MRLLILLLAFALLGGTAGRDSCTCHAVSTDKEPLGGNEFMLQLLREPVREIHGKVSFWINDKPVNEAIIEVFDYPKDEKVEPYYIPEQKKRRVACMTGQDGEFCFTKLPAGRYLLRAGTSNRDFDYFNYGHVIVTVEPKKGADKSILVELSAAT